MKPTPLTDTFTLLVCCQMSFGPPGFWCYAPTSGFCRTTGRANSSVGTWRIRIIAASATTGNSVSQVPHFNGCVQFILLPDRISGMPRFFSHCRTNPSTFSQTKRHDRADWGGADLRRHVLLRTCHGANTSMPLASVAFSFLRDTRAIAREKAGPRFFASVMFQTRFMLRGKVRRKY